MKLSKRTMNICTGMAIGVGALVITGGIFLLVREKLRRKPSASSILKREKEESIGDGSKISNLLKENFENLNVIEVDIEVARVSGIIDKTTFLKLVKTTKIIIRPNLKLLIKNFRKRNIVIYKGIERRKYIGRNGKIKSLSEYTKCIEAYDEEMLQLLRNGITRLGEFNNISETEIKAAESTYDCDHEIMKMLSIDYNDADVPESLTKGDLSEIYTRIEELFGEKMETFIQTKYGSDLTQFTIYMQHPEKLTESESGIVETLVLDQIYFDYDLEEEQLLKAEAIHS